nr:alpha/beta hydrolase [uncultured Oscillibacter sp.]
MGATVFSAGGIPTAVWGEGSDHVILAVHGHQSHKLDGPIAVLAECAAPWQVLSFDLPEHGDWRGVGRRCTTRTGTEDLRKMLDFARKRWARVSLFANSMGVWLSLRAFAREPLEHAWFLSPLVDMERMAGNLMTWFQISEERLRREGVVPTPAGVAVCWEDFRDAREHPVQHWDVPTDILYGGADTVCEPDTVQTFSRRFSCRLEIAEGMEHYFHTPEQMAVYRAWLKRTIEPRRHAPRMAGKGEDNGSLL